ncbi:MAG: hypothetical protein KDC71_15175, partial [Acidobacteria bacterium]|nr:hypothetical protein [Acidobacteriota bacterium]
MLVTAVTSGTPNDRTLGLWYDTLQARWAIYNQDTATNLAIGSRFNVWVVPGGLETQVVYGNGITWVALDGPSFNRRPEGLVFFSTQFNPPEGAGFVYSTEAQRAAFFFDRWYLDNTGGPVFPEDLALLAVGVPANEAHFRQLTSEDTLSLGDSIVVHPLLNGDGFQLPFCANEAYETGSGIATNNDPIAMTYRADVGRWAIHNPAGGSVAADLRFHIGVPERDALSFVHIAGNDNTGGSISLLDHPALNNNPDAVFLVQPVTRSQGFDAVPDVHEVGVVWEATTQHWALWHQDVTAFTVGSLFHIWVPKRHAWRHINTAENVSGVYTTLDHPRINNNPFARILFSKNNTPEALPTMNTNPGRTSLIYAGNRWQLWNSTGVNQFLGIGYNLVFLGND